MGSYKQTGSVNHSKLIHAIASFVVSVSSAAFAWFQQHGNTIATVIAIVAGLYSIYAAHQTARLRNLQIKHENTRANIFPPGNDI
jgi:uncharacterized membrane protein YjjP (DUF1212 family)